MTMSKLKLLSPAGSMAALCAAVQNGADEVYIGASNFSARGNAVNFSDQELFDAVAYAKPRGTKVFLALNTLIYQNEFDKAKSLIKTACDAGIDALIVQDTGIAAAVREMAPEMPLHASTQMTIHSTDGALFAKKMGFERVVLSRELSADRIREICANANIETEVFVHGAICMSYSGKCLMSSMIGGRSGNRGLCAQPCRQLYECNGKKGYFLSPRDMCLVNDIAELENMGVASVKIEGRMKSPEYVATVTRIYRKAIDDKRISNEDMKELTEIFCRGDKFTRGFYGGEFGSKMIIPNQSNDETGRNVSPELLKKAKESFVKDTRKSGIDIELDGTKLTLSQKDKSVTVCATAEDVSAISRDRAEEQLKKLGSTPFYAENICVSGECNIRISTLNGMRREAAEKLAQKLIDRKKVYDYDQHIKGDSIKNHFKLCASVTDMAQARAVAEQGIDRLYISLNALQECNGLPGTEVFAYLPTIISNDEKESVRTSAVRAVDIGVKGFVCDSIEAICLAREFGLPIIGGAGLNITNKPALDFYKLQGLSAATLSAELSARKLNDLANAAILPAEVMVYGRYQLMITQNCIIKNSVGKCTCKAVLKDKTGAQFPVMKKGEGCRNVIYNSRPLFLADKPELMCGAWIGQLCFTTETAEECARIIKLYKTGGYAEGEYTRGYFNK